MPEKKKPAASPKNPKTAEPENNESALISVAKTIGHAAGKLAVKTGIEPAPTPKASKKGKLPAKNKQRLPRRQKKALQKSTASRV